MTDASADSLRRAVDICRGVGIHDDDPDVRRAEMLINVFEAKRSEYRQISGIKKDNKQTRNQGKIFSSSEMMHETQLTHNTSCSKKIE